MDRDHSVMASTPGEATETGGGSPPPGEAAEAEGESPPARPADVRRRRPGARTGARTGRAEARTGRVEARTGRVEARTGRVEAPAGRAPEPGCAGTRWLAAAFTVVTALTWIAPPYPVEQAFHHSLTAVALLALIPLRRHYALPPASLAAVLAFLALHSVAARWMYSHVPYDEWSAALTGVRLSDVFGWERNHFDRLVHLSYGLCAAPVLARYLRERWGLRPSVAVAAGVELVLSTSALYELLEWAIAVTMSPEIAEVYNGQQGDAWDAHKDIALACLGALAAAAAMLLRSRRRTAGSASRS
ncbi:hypothetical protein Ppa05_25030 [Planomonospora parontospora subsp. antibiotica]|nr:hypothetical protein Ppa05_25030 [Planomonospora parontospora subsp. antibiotica]